MLLSENLSTFFSWPETLQETEIKGSRLIYLVEEISRQPDVEAVAWVLLGDYIQVYIENQEQNILFKNFSLLPKRKHP